LAKAPRKPGHRDESARRLEELEKKYAEHDEKFSVVFSRLFVS